MRSLRQNGLNLAVTTAGVGVCALGTVILIAWQVHARAVLQILPTLAPMTRMTALSFLLSGIALLLLNTGHKHSAALLTILTLLLPILVCLEYAFGISFGIDQLLGPDDISNLLPGRMSQPSALCFIGAGLAVIAATSQTVLESALTIVGVLASTITAVGTVSVLSYLLVGTQAYNWRQSSHMALHTAAGFTALGFGLMAWAWKERPEQQESPEWLPLSLGLSLAAAAFGAWQALTAHTAGKMPLISAVILAGGILSALLVAIAVFQAQQARKRSREVETGSAMLQQLFEAAPEGLIMTDPQGNILMANRHAKRIFGFEYGALIGSFIKELLPIKMPETDAKEKDNRTPRSASIPQGLVVNGRRRDGSEFPAEVLLTPLSPGNKTIVLCLVQDITARKRGEEVLRQSEELFRSLFEQSPLGVTMVASDGRLFKVNPAYCRMLGYSEDELTKLRPMDITHPEDREISEDMLENLFRGKAPAGRLEKRYIKKNGEIMWASVSISLVRDPDGNPLYTVGMVADITQQKHAEAELRLGNEIFANMAEGVCMVRMDDLAIVRANPQFEKMFGYAPNELIGKHVSELNSPSYKSPEEVAREIRSAVA